MTIEWLAGNRLRGTTAERPNFGLPSGSVGGWVELGRTTLGATADTLSVSVADKRYYMILADQKASGNTNHGFRLNADTGSNYAQRASADGGTDNTATSNSALLGNWGSAVTTNAFHIGYIANISTKEKLAQIWNVQQKTAGAGTAPSRQEGVGKHAQTTNPISAISLTNTDSGDYTSGTELVVLGWDPADTHTTNFWEELASVTLGTDGDVLSSGTITAKKYLWVQAFIKNSGDTARFNTKITFNNDTSGNYAMRRSFDGGADSTSTSANDLFSSGVTGSNDDLWCINMFIVNNSANEKLCIAHGFDTYIGSGAGFAPSQRYEAVGKWANTSSQITEIDITNTDTSNYDAISELRVWGAD